eukprot:11155520-Lingulodinium_polyedra.AAC.1
MPTCDGSQLHREKGGPLPFFNKWEAADVVAPSKPKKIVKVVWPWDFFNACVARPVSKAELALSPIVWEKQVYVGMIRRVRLWRASGTTSPPKPVVPS